MGVSQCGSELSDLPGRLVPERSGRKVDDRWTAWLARGRRHWAASGVPGGKPIAPAKVQTGPPIGVVDLRQVGSVATGEAALRL